MNRNVFVSFLGTNNYLETYYTFNDVKSLRPVRFVQEVLVENLCRQWTSEDKVLIFCTEQSEKLNWIDNGQGAEIEGLSTRLKQLNLPVQIERVKISEGFSEEEIWSIFNSVYEKLEVGDKIYFDVTHAFRSIPMFSTILFNYAYYMKQTELKAVYYGAFEKLGPAFLVRKMDIEDRVAPIIDLTSTIRLQELSSAASNLHQYGKMTSISELMHINQKKGKEKQDIENIKNRMKDFDLAISTCKLDKIKDGKLIGDLQKLVNDVKKSKFLTHAHRQLIARIENEISVFEPHDTYENVEEAILWARKYDMIQQAYTLAEELTISRVSDLILPECELLQKEKEKARRTFISALLSLDTERKEYENDKKELKELFYQLLNKSIVKALRPWTTEFTGDRNIINHAKKTDKDLVNQFDKDYSEIKEILKNVHQFL